MNNVLVQTPPSLSASGGSRGISRVHEKASSCWLTASVMLVNGLRLNANCPVRTVCCVANLYKVLCLKHTQNQMKLGVKKNSVKINLM